MVGFHYIFLLVVLGMKMPRNKQPHGSGLLTMWSLLYRGK